MSVLIKGMKKPKDCYQCRLHYGHGECGVSVDGNCPIIELPDHGDLIDRDELKEPVGSYLPLKWTYEYGHIITWEDIITAPAIIPADKEDHGETS